MGLSAESIGGIERGHNRPSLDRAERLAAALEFPFAEVFDLCKCWCGCGGMLVDLPRLGSAARFLPGHNDKNDTKHRETNRKRRAQLGIPEEKTCKGCGRTFTRPEVPNQSLEHWISREHCSRKCTRLHPDPEERECALEGCDVRFTPAPWEAAEGRSKYCRDDHYRADPAYHEQASERIKRGKAADPFYAVMRLSKPEKRREWYGRLNGYKGGLATWESGKGGPKAREATVAQIHEVWRLHREGVSLRAIAEEVFGDRALYGRVRRIVGS